VAGNGVTLNSGTGGWFPVGPPDGGGMVGTGLGGEAGGGAGDGVADESVGESSLQ
jgi:hypothetical protein